MVQKWQNQSLKARIQVLIGHAFNQVPKHRFLRQNVGWKRTNRLSDLNSVLYPDSIKYDHQKKASLSPDANKEIFVITTFTCVFLNSPLTIFSRLIFKEFFYTGSQTVTVDDKVQGFWLMPTFLPGGLECLGEVNRGRAPPSTSAS